MNDQHNNETVTPGDDVSSIKPWHLNRNRLFLAFNVLFVLTFFSPLRDLLRVSLSRSDDNYISLIPFMSAYLMYLNRKAIFSEEKSFSVAGLFAIFVGILLLFVGSKQKGVLDHRDYLALVICSSLTIWIGGFVLCYGMRLFRTAAFPLLFLFFLVPIPGFALERAILFLQTGSTEVSYRFLQMAGVPVARNGFIFHLPTIDIEVAKQCSGIRSSLALVITGALASYLFLRKAWTRAILMIVIVPIAVIKNGFRIASLSILGVYVDERILDSDLHRKGGFVFFILALVLVWAVIVLLRKAEGRVALKAKKA